LLDFSLISLSNVNLRFVTNAALPSLDASAALKEKLTVDPLASLLELSAPEKTARGLAYTPAEIAQQPATWIATFDQLQQRREDLIEFLADAGVSNTPEQRPTVFLIGAGTSDYIGRSVHHLLRTQWQCEVIPVASTSLLTDFAESLLKDRRYLWVSFSRSGDSPEGVAVLERALEERPEIAHLLVTCNDAGRMNRAVQGRDHCLSIVLDDATNDRGLAMTSSFTNMVLTGQVLAHALRPEAYKPILHALVGAAEEFLPRAADSAASLAETSLERACFVGSTALAGAALECALKVLELTSGQVKTMTQSTLALRHGPMAALDAETLFVSLVSSHPQKRRYELDLLREVGSKRLARARVAIATNPEGLAGDAEHVLAPETAEAIPDLYRPMLDVIFGQLLGLFASIRCGLKPDAPSPTGAISRVVQNVAIY
jgi:tagatose-6-phosphate ketose/aldose isomerase